MRVRDSLSRRVFAVVFALFVVAITPAGTVAEETEGETAQSAPSLTTPASSAGVLGEVNAASVAEEISGGEAEETVTASIHIDPTIPDIPPPPPPFAIPTLTTSASPGGPVGTQVFDTAILIGGFGLGPGVGPTGSIIFTLFGPDDATCSGTPVFTSPPVVVSPIVALPTVSPSFIPTAPGTYRWTAAYSGDAFNFPANSACNAPNESVVITGTPTSVTTTASPGIQIGGGTVSDTAVLSGGINPTGTMTFSLFGPDDPTCTTVPMFTSTVPVAGNGPYPSDSFTPTQAGTYRWIAAYSGDANNMPTSGACNDANETVVVSQGATAVTTTASADIVLGGGMLSDTATLSGGFNPTGTLTFSLFGPNNATCAGPPIFNSIEPVAGNGNYVSAQFTPTSAGTYRWIASYSGDANNLPSSGACNDANESAVVAPTGVTIITNASPGIGLGGGTLTDSATVVGRVNPQPGASIDFRLYGPGDALCAGPPVFESLNVPYPVTEGPVTSTAFTPTQPGTYRWIASYSGDANNAPITGACNAPNETVVVTEAAGVPAGVPGTTQAGGLVTSAAPVRAPVRAAQLPRTGIEPQRQAILALILLTGGALLLLASKSHLATYAPRHKTGRYTPRHH